MDEVTSFDTTKRQTINPLIDDINKSVEPLLKIAMDEIKYVIPLSVRLYNQIRFYEEYGKLKMGTSVASKETLATQFNVTVKQIDRAYNNLTTKYKLGQWVTHNEPVFRNVTRTWMSNYRLKQLKNDSKNYYGVVPELLRGSSKTTTAEYLVLDSDKIRETKSKLSKTNNTTKVVLAKAEEYGKPLINEMFKYWEQSTGLNIESKTRANRLACNNLLKKYGEEKLKRLIDGAAFAQTDRYAPSIADFTQLQQKLNELLLWGKKNSINKIEVIS
jgi:DNA-binding transcriptional regulator YhcF (GntR family)